MKMDALIGSALAGACMFGVVSCTASLGDVSEGPEIVGEQAELVSRKREWLSNYDEDCDVCFKAFEMCQRGALDDDEQAACEVALDACVRGGMIDDEGDDDGDGDDEDGGVDDGDVDDGRGDDDDDDGDLDEDDQDNDGDVDNGDVDDGDVDDDDGRGDDGDDGDADDGDDEVDDDDLGDDKEAILEEIKVCLADVRDCVRDPDQDRRACVDDLRTCVKGALEGAFDSICEGQINACIERGASRRALESVQSLCEDGVTVP